MLQEHDWRPWEWFKLDDEEKAFVIASIKVNAEEMKKYKNRIPRKR